MRHYFPAVLALLFATFPLSAQAQQAATGPATAPAIPDRPYMGWSSWTLQATTNARYGKNFLNEKNIDAQSLAMHETIQRFGYTYINIDSGWSDGFDDFGRPTADRKRFPSGIASLAGTIHARGQKLGIYYVPGVNGSLLKANPIVEGTSLHIADILRQPKVRATAWRSNDAIDFSKPGAKEYVQSIARQFARWGIDFLKFDGVTPGSNLDDPTVDARDDVRAWSEALKLSGRPIWLTVSWNLHRDQAELWQQCADAWRINNDVETYDKRLTGWQQVRWRFETLPAWQTVGGKGKGWNDLDSIIVANGDLDGLSTDEKRTAMTLWSIACAPLYAGGDLTKLDDLGRSILTNDELIAINQAGIPALLLSPAEDKMHPIWMTKCSDGSTVVALFNLSDQRASVSIEVKTLGVSRGEAIHDLWTHQEIAKAADTVSADLAAHACRCVKIAVP